MIKRNEGQETGNAAWVGAGTRQAAYKTISGEGVVGEALVKCTGTLSVT